MLPDRSLLIGQNLVENAKILILISDTVIGFFNGITITLEDTLRNDTMKHSVHKMWNDWYTDEMIWIPPQYIDINAYNASLGHKINHNSDYNVDAGYIDHPRFGKIRSIGNV